MHASAREALDAGLRIPEQCVPETYSVLTRLPAPHRAPPDVVRDFIRSRFSEPFLRLGPATHRQFVLSLPEHLISGAAAYDALVAATAVERSAELVTCDRRACSVYERYGVKTKVL